MTFRPFAQLVLGLVLCISGPGHAQGLDAVKACFVYSGPIGDGGWTYQHHRGAQAAKAALGERVTIEWQENVSDAETAELVMEQMVASGCDIIFTTAPDLLDATNTAAGTHPQVKFENATGDRRAHPNVSTYNARVYEGRAVQGMLAGRMTRTNRIGYIASVPVPEVIAGINAYYLGARRVNPNTELTVVWANTRFDPAIEARAAETLIATGVDVIVQHTDSTAPLEVAMRYGGAIIGFGQGSDMGNFAPSPRISSVINNWGPYYFRRISALLDGSYAQTDAWDGIASGVVLIGRISEEVPPLIKAEAETTLEAISSGTLHPFTGPLKRQDGSVWLGLGSTASDADIRAMDFYVEGISAVLPQ